MTRSSALLIGVLLSGPAFAEEPADPLDLSPQGAFQDDPVLERVFVPRGLAHTDDGGSMLDSILTGLGIDKERLVEALSEVEMSGAGDNWRDEQSGEVGLSFDLTDKLSIGPSLGLRWEQEHSGAFREEWSHQLKLGARYTF
jgi:hypothetical protein